MSTKRKKDLNLLISKRITKKRKMDKIRKSLNGCIDYTGKKEFVPYYGNICPVGNGNRWSKVGEKELIIYSRNWYRRKIGEKPNPFAALQISLKLVPKVEEITNDGVTELVVTEPTKMHIREFNEKKEYIDKKKKQYSTPIPIYKDRGWQFKRIYPEALKEPKPAIPFTKLLRNPDTVIIGKKTTFKKVIASEIEYHYDYLNKREKYGYPHLNDLVKAIAYTYEPNTKNQEEKELLESVITEIIKEHKDYKIHDDYDEIEDMLRVDFREYAHYHLRLIDYYERIEKDTREHYTKDQRHLLFASKESTGYGSAYYSYDNDCVDPDEETGKKYLTIKATYHCYRVQKKTKKDKENDME